MLDRIEKARKTIAAVCEKVDKPIQVMEVCGTHTVSIFRHGIRSLLPEKITAHPRHVIGGHILGIICGHTGWILLELIPGIGTIEQSAGMGLAVGLTIFLMAVFDMEHPPAAGTAFGIVTTGATIPIISGVLFFAVSLSAIRWVLRHKLRDLT